METRSARCSPATTRGSPLDGSERDVPGKVRTSPAARGARHEGCAEMAHHFPQHPAAAYEAALWNLSRLAGDGRRSLERVFEQATQLIASTLAIERVGIWLFEDGRACLRCACLYDHSANAFRSGDVLRPA